MKDFRRTRIVATIGPASSSVSMLSRLLRAGVTVARLNFSHGTHEEHADLIAHTRAASRKTGVNVALLQDLQGQKIRIGAIDDVDLHKGQKVILVAGARGRVDEIPVQYSRLTKDLKKDHRIYINDGLIELLVTRVTAKQVYATVVQGGRLISHKGVNFPDTQVTAPVFTAKDKRDLRFGILHEVDYVALSFVSEVKDVLAVRQFIVREAKKMRKRPPGIIVKIERKEILDAFVSLLGVVDGVMVARGDLGIEIPFEEVPIVQKEIIDMCRVSGIPVIVATHMLESMTSHVRPTRAEVSDVANAVIDHTDAVMLSAETATGEHPYAVVQTMDRVIRETEHSYLDDISFSYPPTQDHLRILCQSLHRMAISGELQGVIVLAEQEEVLRRLSSYRFEIPVFAFCRTEYEARALLLRSGTIPCVLPSLAMGSFERTSQKFIRQKRYLSKGQKIAHLYYTADGKIQMVIS